MPHSKGVYPDLPTFLDRLNYAFNQIPLSQTKFAKSVGITQATFSNLLSGKNKTSEKLKEIAEQLGVDYQWLITGVSSQVLGESISFVNIELYSEFPDYVNTRNSMLYKSPANSVQLDIRALVNRKINFFDARYIPMTDGGMHPVIKQDSSVFFDTSKTYIEDGRTYVIEHGAMIQVRTLFNAPMASVKINAEDPTFGSIVLDIDQRHDQLFNVLGQVFAVTNYY